MFCMNCGKELQSGAKFCDVCGTKVGDVSSNEVSNVLEKVDNIIPQIKNAKCVVECEKNGNIENDCIVKIGHYNQNNVNDEKDIEIEWLLLVKEKNKALLVSRYILDFKQYDDEENWWENSFINKWLNETFYDKAFSDEEKSLILETENIECEKEIIIDGDWPILSDKILKKHISKDKIFLLSIDECEKYFKYDRNNLEYCGNEYSGSIATEYAKSIEVNGKKIYVCRSAMDNRKMNHSVYFLRNMPQLNKKASYFVWGDGEIATQHLKVDGCGIRPAMWVKI